MASSSILSANKAVTPKDFDPEERKALLASSIDELDIKGLNDLEDKHGWSSRKMALTTLALVVLLVTGVFARTVFPGRRQQPPSSSILRSNGTHEFKPTVLIVSIDGLRCAIFSNNGTDILKLGYYHNRADYLDRGLTPHLLDLSKKGLRAKSMKPVFPVCWHLSFSYLIF